MIAFQSSSLLIVGASFTKSVPLTVCSAPQSPTKSNKWYMRVPRTRLPFDERFRRPRRTPSDFSLPSHPAPATPEENQRGNEKKESPEKKDDTAKGASATKEASNVRKENDVKKADIGSKVSAMKDSKDVEASSDGREANKSKEANEPKEASKPMEASVAREVSVSKVASNTKEASNVLGVSAVKGISDEHGGSKTFSDPHAESGGKPADRTLSTVGRVDLIGTEPAGSETKKSTDDREYEGGTNDKDSGGGSRGGDSNGGGDEGEHDGDGDDREELVRSLRLTEAEGKEATMKELSNLKSASKTPLLGSLALNWPPLRNRLAANRRLYLQLGVEITVGCVTKTLAEIQGRGERFWKEFDFYLSDMALEIFGDALLVWLLSPVVPWRSGGIGKFVRHDSDIHNALTFRNRYVVES